MINELSGRLNKEGKDIAASPVSAAQLGAILDLIGEGTISGKIAKDLFEIVWSEGGDPRAIVEQRGMKQVTDIGAIEKVVDEIIAANPDKVAQAKAKPHADRLVRRPGDEGVRRQGQSAGGQRSAQEQARSVTFDRRFSFARGCIPRPDGMGATAPAFVGGTSRAWLKELASHGVEWRYAAPAKPMQKALSKASKAASCLMPQ